MPGAILLAATPRSLDAQLLHARTQGVGMQPKDQGRTAGPVYDPARIIKRLADVVALHHLKGAGDRDLTRAFMTGILETVKTQYRPLGHDDRPLNYVLKFADISRPGVSRQLVHELRQNPVEFFPVFTCEYIEEIV